MLYRKLSVMKNLLFLLVLTILFTACASTNKVANESLHNAIIGQNEIIVLKRLGMPARVEHTSDGGKVMIYEYFSKGMYLTPYNKPAINYNYNKNLLGETQGLTYTSNTNTVTNDPKYTVYSTNVSYLKVHMDNQGNAIRIEQNLPQEQLDIYHERFKHFQSKDR